MMKKKFNLDKWRESLDELPRNEKWNYQGKSPQQYENSARATGFAILGMIILMVAMTLFGCTTVKSTLTPSELEKVTDCCKDK